MESSLRLSETTAVQYLLRRGLLSSGAVVEGVLSLDDNSRRNRNWQVISDREPSYLLKQAVPGGGAAILDREAAVYVRLTRPEEGAAMAPFLPRCHGYDAEAGILVTEFVQHGESLMLYHGRLGRCQVGTGRAMGLVLGCLHGRVPLHPAEVNTYSQAPWVFGLARPGLDLLQRASLGCLQVARALHRFPDFGERLAELSQEWQSTSFIHGDLKWDHFLRVPPAAGGGMKLVDWELAGPGDPCWDVGAIFAEYLTFWTSGMGTGGEESRFPLRLMRPAIQAFWRAYVRAAGVPEAARAERLLRAIRYGGARLLQNAYQQMQQGTQLTEHAVRLLQLSWNVLKQPGDATATLLGLPVREVGEG